MVKRAMMAAYVTTVGGADGIRVGTLPAPSPGPTDVLVSGRCGGMNAADALVRPGQRAPTRHRVSGGALGWLSPRSRIMRALIQSAGPTPDVLPVQRQTARRS